MAIKVVTFGRLPSEQKMRGKCGHCGCVVECLEGDAKTYQAGPNETGWRVKCPTKGCTHNINLNFLEKR